MQINVPSSAVDVLAEADVVVCGGGCSGVAAAVSAARHGASVILIERWPTVGGMATNGLVLIWHCSDRQKVVIRGLLEESAQRAKPEGWIKDIPGAPEGRHETQWFDPEGMRIIWQRMLAEAKVRLFCYTTAGEPYLRDGRIDAVMCDTKRGRRAIRGRIFIDATGDGDVAAKAGVPFEYGRAGDGLVQGMTLMFSLMGLDEPAIRAAGPAASDRVVAIMRQLRDAGRFQQFNEGNMRATLQFVRNHLFWNVLPVAGNPLDEEELSGLTVKAREMLVEYLALLRKEMPGFAGARIEQTAFTMGTRESRRVQGLKTLTAEMVLGAQKQADAIGHGIWMIDIHDPKGSGYTTYTNKGGHNMLPEGASYHIPLGMCLNTSVPNLAVVGRCASSTH